MVHIFDIGGLWDANSFEIDNDYKKSAGYGYIPCKHAVKVDEENYKIRAVIAYNEGGQCSTGVCLDCIIEAEKTLKKS